MLVTWKQNWHTACWLNGKSKVLYTPTYPANVSFQSNSRINNQCYFVPSVTNFTDFDLTGGAALSFHLFKDHDSSIIFNDNHNMILNIMPTSTLKPMLTKKHLFEIIYKIFSKLHLIWKYQKSVQKKSSLFPVNNHISYIVLKTSILQTSCN